MCRSNRGGCRGDEASLIALYDPNRNVRTIFCGPPTLIQSHSGQHLYVIYYYLHLRTCIRSKIDLKWSGGWVNCFMGKYIGTIAFLFRNICTYCHSSNDIVGGRRMSQGYPSIVFFRCVADKMIYCQYERITV